MNRFAFLLIMTCLSQAVAATTWEKDRAAELPASRSSSEILWHIQKLGTLGRVLYVAAHPDDENTALISHLSLGGKYDTAYLSLTRGDGGQNLIGAELSDALGVIRTQELLAARRIDGGRQFFTRAKDFGYSKTAEETLRIWDREKVLADVVWVVRQFRPDVIVTRFGPEGGFTHGHHTASCWLAMEAFEAAADPQRFPEQLEHVSPWQAKRVVWNTSSWFFQRSGQTFDESQYVTIDVGGYEPLLGHSYNEVASKSRSQHRSQGFGSRVERGSRKEHFQWLAGEPLEHSLFDGIDRGWSRVKGGEDIGRRVARLEQEFDPSDPAASVDALLELRRVLSDTENGGWTEQKRREVDAIIASCLGLSVLAVSDEPIMTPGDDLRVTIEALNRSRTKVTLQEVQLTGTGETVTPAKELDYNQQFEVTITSTLLEDQLEPSQPYWLREAGSLGMFAVPDLEYIGLPENPSAYAARVDLQVGGEQIGYQIPVVYREVDPARGEDLRPVLNGLAASVQFESPVLLFSNYDQTEVRVTVAAPFKAVSGELELRLPEGWSAKPQSHHVSKIERGGRATFAFAVAPPRASQEVELQAILKTEEGNAIAQSVSRISYDHIPEQLVFEPSAAKAVSLSVAKLGKRVAYIQGAGDSVARSIEEIGYEVTELSPGQVNAANLEGYDAVVLGIRAYNTIGNMDRLMPILFKYASEGGVVIAQYNTSNRLHTDRVAPYPLRLSRDRVTDENAPARLLAPTHRALNAPNKINGADFEGWVQERGLYFPDQWDEAFVPLVSFNDPGEPPSDGGILVARHGDGYFVYTGISWFRQLPAGVPGAYRLFANLLSLGADS